MYLLELAIQGARDFLPTQRAALKPGYTVLKPAAATPPLVALVSGVLYADGRGAEASLLSPGIKSGKVAITLLGNDQGTYRVARQLGGAGALHRLEKTSSTFELITEDASEAQQFLRSQVGLPTRGAFEQLFTLTAAQLPSRKPKAPAASASAGAAKPALAQNAPVSAASDVAAAQAKLRELENERTLSDEVEKLQFRVDGIASQLFEMESKVKSTEGVKAALADAERAYANAPTPESMNLPADILDRVQRYSTLAQRRDDALARLEAEAGDELELGSPGSVPPLTKDMRFVGAVTGGAVVLVIGLFLRGMARYVSLLDIPAFSFAAVVALKYVDDLQHATQQSRKGGRRAVREKKIRDDFEAEAQPVRIAMNALNVESPSEVADLFARRDLLAQRVEDYRAQLQQLESDPDYARAAAEYEQLKQQQDELNAELAQKGSYVRDIREVEREIARVKESIQLAKAPAAAAPAATTAAAPSGAGFEDPAPALMKHATDLLQIDVPSVGALVTDRAAQYVAALSDRRYVGIELDMQGRAFALAPSGKTPFGELAARDLDLAYLALRMTVIEKICAKTKVPLLVEDTFGIEEAKLGLVARMVKHLGTLTQVLHATSNAAFASVADATIPV